MERCIYRPKYKENDTHLEYCNELRQQYQIEIPQEFSQFKILF